MARSVLTLAPVRQLVGVDVDRAAIRWAKTHLSAGQFSPIDERPPTGLPARSFDVVYAVSVFTHLSEDDQRSWLSHLANLLAPGGLLIASTHSPDLKYTLPGLSPSQIEALRGKGFLFVSSGGSFNEDAAFHSLEYLDRTWSRWFARMEFLPYGLGKHQDLSVWRVR